MPARREWYSAQQATVAQILSCPRRSLARFSIEQLGSPVGILPTVEPDIMVERWVSEFVAFRALNWGDILARPSHMLR